MFNRLRQAWSRLASWLDKALGREEEWDVEMVDVLTFQEKLGHLVHYNPTHCTQRKLHERLQYMREELEEFEDAVRTQDLVKQLDALLDLVYFAKGTANTLGFGPVWVAAWAEVQRANMSKKRGVTRRGFAVDATKPKNWVGPEARLAELLAEAGYDRKEYESSGVFSELWASDDPGAKR